MGPRSGALIGLVLAASGDGLFTGTDYAGAFLAAWVVAWIVVGFAILPYLTVVPATWLVRRVEELSTAEFVAAVLGLLIGLLMGLLLGFPLSNFPEPWGTWLPLGVSILFGLGMLGLTVAKRKDLLIAAEAVGLLRRRGPAADERAVARRAAHRRRHERDHRRADRRDRRVRVHLRHARDPALRARRAPAHRRQLGRAPPQPRPARARDPEPDAEGAGRPRSRSSRTTCPTSARSTPSSSHSRCARSRVILTNDFNLNRVAELQGVRVMNINSLANAVKPAVLPGEELRVRVIQEGKEAGQGVGFLDDGTMIVVEGGARHIDRELDVSVTRVLQTVAGRMIFAQPRLD